jgi:S-adenosylmethionine:tRNA ribosyltransferase-isomerase
VDIPDYELPPEAIAQTPAEPRHAARLLDGRRPSAVVHRTIRDLPDLLGPGDVVVVNSSRVIPARLALHKVTGGAAEVLLLEAVLAPGAGGKASTAASWRALVRPGRRLPPGTVLYGEAGGALPVLEVGERLADGVRTVTFAGDPETAITQYGTLALPPYISEPLADPGRYQTVYADRPGSVAAPTAGLHLSDAVLAALVENGVEIRAVDLAVGLATFRPVTAERAEDHVMHVERYRVPEDTWQACRQARRVVAVGTTSVRALETAASTGELEGESSLFIRDGFSFEVVDLLVTNFHLPRSTLLLLLQAFCGPVWRDLYALALAEGYRFLSFGDAMLVARS